MPMTPELRRNVDDIRNYLYGGGYPDPLNNAEQLSFLFFFYLIEGLDQENQLRAKVTKQKYQSLFAGDWELKNPNNRAEKNQSSIPKSKLCWSVWARGMSGEALVRFVRDEVFPFYTEVADRSAFNFMVGARLDIQDPTVLTQVIGKIDQLRLDQQDADTKGDLFEHVLRQVKQAGELGQFRTPRHIIRAIVEMVDPKIGETIYDPAAGTAGFLVAAYNHIRLTNSSPSGTHEVELEGKTIKRGLGDKLSAKLGSRLQNETFYGNDVDPKMVRLATMNLTLRGLPNTHILRRNVLTTTLDAQQRVDIRLPENFDVILANPPFSGRVDADRIVDDVKIGNTSATEILFLKYMVDSLKSGGRCGVIVPEGVLFGSTKAHKELRRILVENNTVEAVLSLPGGVFQPYSGVKTSVLLFKKGGSTQRVLFLNCENDGYKLDAQHDTPVEADDLPELAQAYRTRAERAAEWSAAFSPSPLAGEGATTSVNWPHNWWFATRAQLAANDHNLSAGRYRPVNKTETNHRTPLAILTDLRATELEVMAKMEALEVLLGEVEA